MTKQIKLIGVIVFLSLLGFLIIKFSLLNIMINSMELLTVPILTSLFFFPLVYINKSLLPINTYRSLQTKIRCRPILSIGIAILFTAILVYFIFGKILLEKWGAIDDHEIMNFIGPGDRLLFQDFFARLSQTEVAHFGDSTRFRPTYYFLHLVECIMWGKNPMLWYAARLVLLIVSLSLFWILLTPVSDWIIAGSLSAYLLTFPLWTDIFARLGPSETYAVLGLPLYVLGTLWIIQSKKHCIYKRLLTGMTFLVGSILCYGSKENFLILIIPSFYIAYLAFKKRNFVYFGFVSVSILFSLYIGSSLMITFAKTTSDVYANPVSPISRMTTIIQMLLKNNYVLVPILCLIFITILLQGLHFFRGFSKEHHKAILIASFWVGGLFILYIFQLYFYNGAWPTGMRYDFPGILYIPILIVILYWLTRKLIIGSAFQEIKELSLKTSLIIGLLLVIFFKGYSNTIETIQNNVQNTNGFTQQIERFAKILNENENYALVLESGNVWDYEFIFSYQRFLDAYQVKNKFFLRMNGYSSETVAPGLPKILASDLTNISENGFETGDVYYYYIPGSKFLPLSQLSHFGKMCYSIRISGDLQTNSNCELLR